METEPMDQVLAILRACPGIQSLSVWDINCYEPSLLKLREEFQFLPTPSRSGVPFPKLRQLSLPSLYLCTGQRHFAHPLFRNLTHLEALIVDWFVDYDDDPQEWDWRTGLTQLKHLTHFLVSAPICMDQTLEQGIREILVHCPPSLQVFISWIENFGPYGSAETNQIEAIQRGDLDIRVVLVFMEDEDSSSSDDEGGPNKDSSSDSRAIICSVQDREQDWNGAEVEKTIWRRAEEVIEGRRRRLRGE
jgi:hypothetical protein